MEGDGGEKRVLATEKKEEDRSMTDDDDDKEEDREERKSRRPLSTMRVSKRGPRNKIVVRMRGLMSEVMVNG